MMPIVDNDFIINCISPCKTLSTSDGRTVICVGRRWGCKTQRSNICSTSWVVGKLVLSSVFGPSSTAKERQGTAHIAWLVKKAALISETGYPCHCLALLVAEFGIVINALFNASQEAGGFDVFEETVLIKLKTRHD